MGNMMSELSLSDGCQPMLMAAAARSHILIVDDEPPNQLILEDLLGQQFNVHCASNGRQALAYLKEKGQTDLILLDINSLT